MGNRDQTTVNLTIEAQEIKEDLAPVYGLKTILSAGLILLNKLSDTNQKSFIKEVAINEEKLKNNIECSARSGQNVLIRTKARVSKKKQSLGQRSKERA